MCIGTNFLHGLSTQKWYFQPLRYPILQGTPIPNPQESVNEHTFHFELDRERLRREGRYLLRSNMQAASPETVWESYLPPSESIGGI